MRRNRIIDNPYAAESVGQTGTGVPSFEPRISPSILVQIRVIAVLLIVHGALLLLTGGVLIAVSIVMPGMIAAQQQKMQQPPPNGPSPAQMQTILFATYISMGIAGFIPGIIQIVAGILNFGLKGRVLGIVALVMGSISIGTCYCGPTSIALLVYGLIIYLNNSSVQAFALAKQGLKWSDIENMTRQ